jgi:hypothetical protein
LPVAEEDPDGLRSLSKAIPYCPAAPPCPTAREQPTATRKSRRAHPAASWRRLRTIPSEIQ